MKHEDSAISLLSEIVHSNLLSASLNESCKAEIRSLQRAKLKNARLLEALKDLVNGTDPHFAEIYGFSEQHNAAREAIAEAENQPSTP